MIEFKPIHEMFDAMNWEKALGEGRTLSKLINCDGELQTVKILPAETPASIEMLSFFQDYELLTSPHLASLREVLHGMRSRYKFTYEDATLIFDHGCLMGRVYRGGRFYALPPMGWDAQGQPYLREIPAAQRAAMIEFCRLPKGVLLFYFTLLKQVFDCRPLKGQRLNPHTGQVTEIPVPPPLRPWLDAVGWPYASITEPLGCRAS